MSVEWTGERRARVRELHGQGLSYSVIAERLSGEFRVTVTKNAVVGHALFCGEPVERGGYCEHHAAVCFRERLERVA